MHVRVLGLGNRDQLEDLGLRGRIVHRRRSEYSVLEWSDPESGPGFSECEVSFSKHLIGVPDVDGQAVCGQRIGKEASVAGIAHEEQALDAWSQRVERCFVADFACVGECERQPAWHASGGTDEHVGDACEVGGAVGARRLRVGLS